MRMSTRRVRAIVRKELREYRRNRSVVVAMAIFPAHLPHPAAVRGLPRPERDGGHARQTSTCCCTCSRSRCSRRRRSPPTPSPASVSRAASSRSSRRRSGARSSCSARRWRRSSHRSRSPMPCTRSSSPASCCSRSPASRQRSSRPRTSLAQVLFTPLLAAWSIWVGIAISTRSSDVRVAQQLSLLANLPVVVVTSLIAFDVIHPTPGLAVGLAVDAADRRRARLADRGPDVRPREAHHGHEVRSATPRDGRQPRRTRAGRIRIGTLKSRAVWVKSRPQCACGSRYFAR